MSRSVAPSLIAISCVAALAIGVVANAANAADADSGAAAAAAPASAGAAPAAAPAPAAVTRASPGIPAVAAPGAPAAPGAAAAPASPRVTIRNSRRENILKSALGRSLPGQIADYIFVPQVYSATLSAMELNRSYVSTPVDYLIRGYYERDGTYVSPHYESLPGRSCKAKSREMVGGYYLRSGQFVAQFCGVKTRNANHLLRRPEFIQSIQHKLTDLGFYGGPIDGQFGRDTAKAISEFRSDAGLKFPEANNLSVLLYLGIDLGDEVPDLLTGAELRRVVWQVQTALFNAGLYKGQYHGLMDELTQRGLLKFKKLHGLPANYDLDISTLRSLGVG